MEENCLFCKIIEGKIPSERVYEDEDMIVIKDISPQAKIHLLMIPKEHYSDITKMSESQAIIFGKCVRRLGQLALELGMSEGFRIVSNCGDFGCQSVHHLHVHLLGGEQLSEKMS